MDRRVLKELEIHRRYTGSIVWTYMHEDKLLEVIEKALKQAEQREREKIFDDIDKFREVHLEHRYIFADLLKWLRSIYEKEQGDGLDG